jgi:glyoxylase-like metal-dependent hydrolase (beta-lactamase superfamily II)
MVGPPPASWEIDSSAAVALAVEPGLWRLRLPLPWRHISHANAYAVEREDGRLVLFDCGGGGDPSCLAGLERALAQIGRGVADIAELVITHAHSDHLGTAASIAARADCTVWIHPARAHFEDVGADPAGVRTQRARGARRWGVPEELVDECADVGEELHGVDGAVRCDRALAAGTSIPSALGAWRAIATPGHAPSHVCLFQPERGVLIAGDLVGPIFAPSFDVGYTPDPVGEQLASLGAAAALRPRLALPGHGRPLTDPAAVFAAHTGGVAERLAAVKAALAGAALTPYETAVALFGRPEDPDERVWRLIETLAYLEHLAATGAAASTDDAVIRFRLT